MAQVGTEPCPECQKKGKDSDGDNLWQDRFWSKVSKGGPDECWEWTAGLFSSGYGAFCYENQNRGAHRMSFLIAHGSLPDDLFICHSCNNPKCVNPDHLYAGTQKENMQDRMDNGGYSRGQEHPMSKLTSEDVACIKRHINMGTLSQKEMAQLFGVTQTLIHYIKKGRVWAE